MLRSNSNTITINQLKFLNIYNGLFIMAKNRKNKTYSYFIPMYIIYLLIVIVRLQD